ncbi:MAG: DUF2330 domain-containing protein [Myxococcaceae bacterium]|nr:DUF2330 domain-containing protein [Myxococcaceae bacterium]
MRTFTLSLGTLCCAALLLSPGRTEACGGFFCSNVPILQSGEDIVFDIGDGKVEAHIGIQYAGEATDFSWVVPVHGVPTLKVSSPQFLQYVRQATQPSFQLQWDQNSCWEQAILVDAAAKGYPPGANADAGTSGVTVLYQGQVGPYDSVVLAADDRQLLAGWLKDNGYTLADPSVLDPYLGQGYNFLALKLQKDRSVGELRPIAIDFGGALPCIPIRLTAVATRPDLPITAYVFAEHRAVPVNYRHALINETRIDWLRGASNYLEVASRAVDEAGGRAFLTEYAGPSAPFANPPEWMLPGPSLDTSILAQKTHPVDFTLALFAQNFPRGDGAIFAMFQKYIPLPKALEGIVTPQQFYNSIEQYRSDIDNDPNRLPFDAAGFAQELQTTIVEPLLHAREILEHRPYLTRLFTTMSAEEMTVDPEFDFNATAPEVKQVHTATATATCNLDGTPSKVRITLEDGRSWEVEPYGSGGLVDGPYAERIEQYAAIGGPGLIADNTPAIDDVIRRAGGSLPGVGCACNGAAAAGPGGALLLFGLLSLGARRSARRRC